MDIDRLQDNEYFALVDTGNLLHLGNCGDYEAADEIAEDNDLQVVWLVDGATVKQWQSIINAVMGD